MPDRWRVLVGLLHASLDKLRARLRKHVDHRIHHQSTIKHPQPQISTTMETKDVRRNIQ